MNLKIGLDMDGVIVDFMEPICDWLGIRPENITSYTLEDMFPNKKAEIKNFYGQSGYFKNLKPYKGAIDFVESLIDMEDVSLWLVSKPARFSPVTWSDKIEWIYAYLPQLIDHTILTQDKSIIDVDILIDDDFNNLISNSAKHKFLFNQPWNKNYKRKDLTRVVSYKQILSKIEKLRENK